VAAQDVLHVLVPDTIDDPLRPSGGNRYDRSVCDRLAGRGWRVHEHTIPDEESRAGRRGREALAGVVSRIPDGAVVLVDGLIAGASAPVLLPAAHRLSLVVLVHMPPGELGIATEQAQVLAAARRVIATSCWVRDELHRAYPLRSDAVEVAEPGVDPSALATGTPSGTELLCVAAVARHKGHDVLLAALGDVAHQRWHCRCVGSLDRDPQFVIGLCRQVQAAGLDGRVEFNGPRTGADLEAAFSSADVLVHPARVEGYGMVVTEALARGLPVITTRTGGLPDALGATTDGLRPGLLVPVGDAPALARAISIWLTDQELRARLRFAAQARRPSLPTWSATTERVEQVLRAVA
jgi:glycosyltransferase involved in cell wall biosynthesis